MKLSGNLKLYTLNTSLTNQRDIATKPKKKIRKTPKSPLFFRKEGKETTKDKSRKQTVR